MWWLSNSCRLTLLICRCHPVRHWSINIALTVQSVNMYICNILISFYFICTNLYYLFLCLPLLHVIVGQPFWPITSHSFSLIDICSFILICFNFCTDTYCNLVKLLINPPFRPSTFTIELLLLIKLIKLRFLIIFWMKIFSVSDNGDGA